MKTSRVASNSLIFQINVSFICFKRPFLARITLRALQRRAVPKHN